MDIKASSTRDELLIAAYILLGQDPNSPRIESPEIEAAISVLYDFIIARTGG